MMELSRLFKEIKNNTLQPLYILETLDRGVANIYIEQLKKVVGEYKYCDSVANVYSELAATSLFGDVACYFVRNDEEFHKVGDFLDLKEKLETRGKMAILLYSNLPKSTNINKVKGELVVKLGELEVTALFKHFEKLDLEGASLRKLVNACERNLSRILIELQNIEDVAYIYGTSMERALDIWVEQILVAEEVKPFHFCDLVFKKSSKAIEYLSDYKEHLSTLFIAQLLYTGYKNLLCIKDNGVLDLEKNTGVVKWSMGGVANYKGLYTIEELKRKMKFVRSVEVGVKTGEIPEGVSLDYLIVGCL